MKRSGSQSSCKGTEIWVIPQNCAGSHKMRSFLHVCRWKETFSEVRGHSVFKQTTLKLYKDRCLTIVAQTKGINVCVFSICKFKLACKNRPHMWQHIAADTWCSTYHCQDGIEENVQLHYCRVCVVQNGPGQFKHTVLFGQVQVVQNFLVIADFLRGCST